MDGMDDRLAAGSEFETGMEAQPGGRAQALEQCVPLAALGIPGEGEQMENPEVGDLVDYQVSGKVTRIEGDKAYVMPEAVNGQEVKADAPTQQPDEYAGLQQAADELGALS